MIKAFDNLESKLKELGLEEEQIKGIVDFEKHNIPKDFMPSDDFKDKLKERESKIEELEESIKTIEDKSSKVDELLKNNDELKSQVDAITKEKDAELETIKNGFNDRIKLKDIKSRLKDRLIEEGADAETTDLIITKLEYDDKLKSLELNDDKRILGEDDIVNPLKEKYTHNFAKKNIKNDKPDDSSTPAKDDGKADVRKAMGLK